MTTFKDTYDYCQQLIDEQINHMIQTAHLCSGDEELETFKEVFKGLYDHLDNIRAMKNSYNLGR